MSLTGSLQILKARVSVSEQIDLINIIGPTGVYTTYMTEGRFCLEGLDVAHRKPTNRGRLDERYPCSTHGKYHQDLW